jgi:uncharacterized membrane protein YoaK (UPF0700 family)
MKWSAFVSPVEAPRAVPILLAGVAGYVDACTFLGLFGFYVAQVTGSYVTAGAHIIAGSPGAAALLAVPIFIAAGAAATLVAILGQAVAGAALAFALAFETLLLIGFLAAFAFGSPFSGPPAALGAAMFGLAAMGAQSALVRLLMRGVASTNVMTTNTSQIAVDATQLLFAWWRGGGDGTADAARPYEACRRRFLATYPLPLAFLAGTTIGAVAFAAAGYWVLLLPIWTVAAITAWAAHAAAKTVP